MSDHDLIRRGDALAEIRRIFNGYPNWVTDAIAALPPAKQDDLASGKAVTVSAADLLKDVPRHSLDFCDRMEIDKDGVWMHEDHVLAALEPVAAPDPALRPTMTDMMVDPDTLDAFMEANPLPPDPAPTDPAAIREAWEKAYWRMRSYAVHDNDCKLNKPPRFDGPCSCGLTAALEEALALIQKGTDDDLPSVVQDPAAQHLVPKVR